MKVALGLREWGIRESAAALSAACRLQSAAQADAHLTAWFEMAFGSPALVVDGGRSALQLALEQLRSVSPDRTEVILPAYGCPALSQAVKDSGLVAVYSDVDGDLNTPVSSVRACLGPRTLAFVMVHAYGQPADVEGLVTVCRAAGVALIDDAAQRIDPTSRLGTAGSFGVFSFAQSKSVVAGIDGAGGVLLVHDRAHLGALRQRVAILPRRRLRLLAWLDFLVAPHWPAMAYRLARLRKALSPAPTGPLRIGGIDAAVAVVQLSSLPERLRRRRAVLSCYQDALKAVGLAAAQGSLGDGYLARLMVHVPATRRDACRAGLHAMGVSTRLPYRLPDGVTLTTHPVAARAATALLELPTPARLSAAEALPIARTLASLAADGEGNFTSTKTHPCCTTGN